MGNEKLSTELEAKLAAGTKSAFSQMSAEFKKLSAAIKEAAKATAKMGDKSAANALRQMGTIVDKWGKDVQGGAKNLGKLQKSMAQTAVSSDKLANKTNFVKDAFNHYSNALGTSAGMQKKAVASANQLFEAKKNMAKAISDAGGASKSWAKNLKATNVLQGVQAGHLKLVGNNLKVVTEEGYKYLGLSKKNEAALRRSNNAYSNYEKLLGKSAATSKTASAAVVSLGQKYGTANEQVTIWGQALGKATQAQNRMAQGFQNQNAAIGGTTKNLGNYIKGIDRVALTQGVLEGNIKATANGFKLLNEKGLAALPGMTERVARNFGLLDKSFVNVSKSTETYNRMWANLVNRLPEGNRQVVGLNKAISDGRTTKARAVEVLGQYVKRQKETVNSTGKLGKAFEYLGSRFRTFTAYAVAASSTAAVLGTAFQTLTTNIQQSQALKDLEAITQATTDEIAKMDEKIRQVADTTKFSAQEVAEGMKIIGQAGFSASESMGAIQATADLATGTLTQFASAADLVTTTIRVFQMEAEKATKVADVFTNAVNNSKLTIDKIRIAMNYIGPIANRAGVSFEDTAASMMILGNTGLRASSIATGLRRVISQLVDPSNDMRAAFQKAGYAVEDLNPQIHDMRTVIGRLSNVVTSADVAFQLFGIRGATAASALATQGVAAFDKMANAVTREGTAAENARIQMEGLGISFKNLADKVKNLALAFGDAGLNKILKLFVDGARAVVDVLTDLISSKVLQWVAAFTTALGLLTVAKTRWVLVTKAATLWQGKLATAVLAGTNAIRAMYATLTWLITPLRLIGIAAGVLTFQWLKNRESIDDLILSQAKLEKDARKMMEVYEDEIQKFKEFNGTAEEKTDLIDRLAKSYPEFAEQIYKTSGNLDELVLLFGKMKEEQKDTAFKATIEGLEALGRKVKDLSSIIRSEARGEKNIFLEWFRIGDSRKEIVEKAGADLKEIVREIQNKLIDLQEDGVDFEVASFFPENIFGTSKEVKEIIKGIEDVLAARKRLMAIERPNTNIGIFSKLKHDLDSVSGSLDNVDTVLDAYDRQLRRTTEGSRLNSEANVELKFAMDALVKAGGPLAEQAQSVSDSISSFGEKTEFTEGALADFRRQILVTRLDDFRTRIDSVAASQQGLKDSLSESEKKVHDNQGVWGRISGAYYKAREEVSSLTETLDLNKFQLNSALNEFLKLALSMDNFSLESTDAEFLKLIDALGMSKRASAEFSAQFIAHLQKAREEAAKPIQVGDERYNKIKKQIADLDSDIISFTSQMEEIEKGWGAAIKPAEDAFKSFSDASKTALDQVRASFTDNTYFREYENQIREVNKNVTLSEQEKADKINQIQIKQSHKTVAILHGGLSRSIGIMDQEKKAYFDSLDKMELDKKVSEDKKHQYEVDFLAKKKDLYVQARDILKQELDRAVQLYQEYAGKVTAIEEQIKDLRKSTQDALRDLTRRTMTEEQVYYDKQKEIAEKLAQLEELRGQKTEEAANKAKELYREIESLAKGTANAVSKTVKEYDRETGKYTDATQEVISQARAVQTSSDQIKRASELTEGILDGTKNKFKDLATQAKANMEVIQMNFDELAVAADEFGVRFQKAIDDNLITSLNKFNTELEKLVKTGQQELYLKLESNLEETKQQAEDLRNELNTLQEQREVNINTAPVDSALDSIKQLKGSLEEIDNERIEAKVESPSADRVLDKLNKIKNVKIPTKYVDVVYREKKNLGGPVMGFNSGGNVPGQGSGDTVPAMLTPNEYVQPVPAVKKYGVAFMEALRKRLIPKEAIDAVMQNKKRTTITKPAFEFNTGGSVSTRRNTQKEAPVDFGTLTLAFGNDTFPVQAPIDVMQELSSSLRRQRMSRSNA